MYKLCMQWIKLSLIILIVVTMTGCWSATNIQDQHYVSALGVDYDGENFILYAQTLNFQIIASSETQQGVPKNTSYVGKGIGKTMHTAAADLYKTAQMRVDWGHTQSIVVSERAILLFDSELVDRIYRFPDNRYNVWLFVTKEPIDEVFMSDSFYNFSTLRTILHVPLSSYNQLTTIMPIQMFKYLSLVNEPDRISFIPCLGFDQQHWESENEPLKLLKITGAYFSSDTVNKILDNDQLIGFRWLQRHLKRTMVIVSDEETSYGVITIDHAKVKKKAYLKDGSVKFVIEASYRGSMNEYINEIDYAKMVELAKEQIKKEIIDVYNVGVEEELDLFDLMHCFRMKSPSKWKQMTNSGAEFILNKQSLEDIKIKLTVPTNGKYKRQK